MRLAIPHGLLIDITRCLGCGLCVESCRTLHGLPPEPAPGARLSASDRTVVENRDGHEVRRMCMHCLDPACASACPVAALRKTPLGPVVYDAGRCLGCRYCLQACPFDVPRYEWHSPAPKVVKCDLCTERVTAGGIPACAENCPAEATIWGPRRELLREARRRIQDDPASYYPRVYGLSEGGGTSVLFLSPVPFEELGFRTDLPTSPLPDLTAVALERVPGIVGAGTVLLSAIWWITERRAQVARAEGGRRRGRKASADGVPVPLPAGGGREEHHA